MEWYRKLYLSDALEGKRNKLISQIEKNAGTRRIKGIYVITLSSNEKNLLDIFSADYLLQPVLHSVCPMIIGLADDYDEAVELAISILTDAYERYESFDVVRYLEENISDQGGLSYRYPMENLKKRSFLFPDWFLSKLKSKITES